MTCEATSGPTYLFAHLPNRQTLPGEGWHVPTQGLTELCSGRQPGRRCKDKLLPFLHIFIQQMDGAEYRTDNSQVSINKRHGDSRGPVPPHLHK